jgi:hypothetical protein
MMGLVSDNVRLWVGLDRAPRGLGSKETEVT